MEKKSVYTPPTVDLVELEIKENILQASKALGNGDTNNVNLIDDTFGGEFRSNSNLWDID